MIFARGNSESNSTASATPPTSTAPTTTFPRDAATGNTTVDQAIRSVQGGIAQVEEVIFDLGLARDGIGEGPPVEPATCQPTLGDPVPVLVDPERDVRPMGGTALSVTGSPDELAEKFTALSATLDDQGWTITALPIDGTSALSFEGELSGVRVRSTLSPVVDDRATLTVLAEGDCITVE